MERHMEYMKRRLREEAEKCKIKDVLMNPLEASKRIVALEKRLDELEGALIAERTREVKPDWSNNDIHHCDVYVYPC